MSEQYNRDRVWARGAPEPTHFRDDKEHTCVAIETEYSFLVATEDLTPLLVCSFMAEIQVAEAMAKAGGATEEGRGD